MRAVVVWIHDPPASPNARPKKLRERMAMAKAERERAMACCYMVRNRDRAAPFYSGTVEFEVHRNRLLDYDNLVSSLKHMQDGVCQAFLPAGDGPTAPYRWRYSQVQVKKALPQGVKVRIFASE